MAQEEGMEVEKGYQNGLCAGENGIGRSQGSPFFDPRRDSRLTSVGLRLGCSESRRQHAGKRGVDELEALRGSAGDPPCSI